MNAPRCSRIRVVSSDATGTTANWSTVAIPAPTPTGSGIGVIDFITAFVGADVIGNNVEVRVSGPGSQLITKLVAYKTDAEPLTISESFPAGVFLAGRDTATSASSDGGIFHEFLAGSGLSTNSIVSLYVDGTLLGTDSLFTLTVGYHTEPLSWRRT